MRPFSSPSSLLIPVHTLSHHTFDLTPSLGWNHQPPPPLSIFPATPRPSTAPINCVPLLQRRTTPRPACRHLSLLPLAFEHPRNTKQSPCRLPCSFGEFSFMFFSFSCSSKSFSYIPATTTASGHHGSGWWCVHDVVVLILG